jgi:hypothetical protein
LIYNEISGLDQFKDRRKRFCFGNKLLKIIYLIYGFFLFKYKLHFKKYEYIFFVTSRNFTREGKPTDAISKDILNAITDNKFVIESVNFNNKNNFFHIFDYDLAIKVKFRSFIYKVLKNNYNYSYSITSILKEEFNIKIDLDSEISSRIFKHKIQLKHYSNIFRLIRPKAIFIMQNGINKAIFESANILQIRVIELQHGYIGYVHPAYSYPKNIKPGDLNTLPSDFFAFSNFWTSNLNFPVKNIHAIGTSYYSIKPKPLPKEYDLTFIFTDLYVKIFLQIIDDLLNKNYLGNICIKLHPNQTHDFAPISDKYSKKSNIIVLTNEFSMTEVLNKSKAIVGIQSTSFYEAIHIGSIKLLILKDKDYQLHKDIFDFNNVHLIDNADDIIKNIESKPLLIFNKDMFDKFRLEVFDDFLVNLK